MGRRAAILLVVAGALVVSTPAAGAKAADPPPTGVHSLGPVPPEVRPTVLVHARNQVLVFGVDGKATRPMRNAGAVYSVARNQWRSMARAPFDPVVALPAAVWTGRELVVVGLACAPHQYDDEGNCRRGTYRGATYVAAKDRWRVVRVPAALAKDADAGYSLGEVDAVGWSDGQAVFLTGSAYWAFAPGRGRWEHLPDSATYSCATKRALVSLVGTTVSVLERGAPSWSDAAPVPAGDAAGPFYLACADDAVYVHPSVLTAAWRYDLGSKQWDTLPAPPSPAALTGAGAWTGRGFLVGISIRTRESLARSTDGFLFDPAAANWSTVAEVVGLEGPASWQSGYAYTFGYDETSRTTLLQTYRPG